MQRNGNRDEITPSKSLSDVRVLSSPRIDLDKDNEREPNHSDDEITPIVELFIGQNTISVNLSLARPQPPSNASVSSSQLKSNGNVHHPNRSSPNIRIPTNY